MEEVKKIEGNVEQETVPGIPVMATEAEGIVKKAKKNKDKKISRVLPTPRRLLFLRAHGPNKTFSWRDSNPGSLIIN